ncbi:SRPBCC family protein [Gracilimonas mengyeensis]|uniref:Polyketide cyclase / dehydrase and lipid transport n=1 Tax=Gracilimonas mengyeensis TaxID=1302730 RepID=A0A521BHR1_9BACT|nr:SRPBCC family protein [Gracilimonas mengyeensis]SMO46622.1 Polyketide cyclase / dehydrase and lipid transport [Gracilimonas mengyeensis]
MTLLTVTKQINAPLNRVFNTISDIRNFTEAVPDIVHVEFLTEQKHGVGTKFRETREINGRKATTDLEVTELKEDEYIRLVSDAGGTIWDSLFTVKEKKGVTELTLTMEAKPYKMMAKLTTPLMKGIMKKALKKDMISLKNYCEADAPKKAL